MNIYSKLHGTTADRFRIGSNSQTIILTGETTSASSSLLLDRDGTLFVVSSTVFFTMYIVGQGENQTAAYEIKGCYVNSTKTVTGYVVNTFVDSANFIEPSIQFNSNDELEVSCTGVNDDTMLWTANINFVII